jgi:hypothetical protein
VRSYIGITTGRIFCGSIGNDSRREYTTIGNAVNLSARLMGAAVRQDEIDREVRHPDPVRPGHVRSGERMRWSSSPFHLNRSRGGSEPVEVFHPLDLKKSVIRPKTELIGRQEEKALIANALQELSRGEQHQTIVLQGEAGSGNRVCSKTLCARRRPCM